LGVQNGRARNSTKARHSGRPDTPSQAYPVTTTSHPVLPPLDCDLAALAATPIPGPRAKGWPKRAEDATTHLQQLRPEFGGTSEAAHLLASTIVVLRRDPVDAHAAALFRRLLAKQGAHLAPLLSLRWLISVCDTVADLPGVGLAERSIAMMGSALANTVKLAETERRIYHVPRPWPPRLRFDVGHEMFDGLKAYWPGRGDMVDNLMDRLGALLDDPEAQALPVPLFTAEILIRLLSAETVFGRFSKLRGKQPLPQVPDHLREKLAALAARL